MGLLVFRDPGTDRTERLPLNAEEEQAVVAASRALVAHSVSSTDAVITHKSDEGRTSSWNHEGALELARALPPVFANLSNAILEVVVRHGGH